MKILVDATGVSLEKAGVGVYALNLIDHLTRQNGIHEFVLLTQDDDPGLDFGNRPNVSVVKVAAKLFRKPPLRFLLEQLYLPLLLWRLRVDVLHSLHYAVPLISFGTRRVVTFHDMTFFDMPEVHEKLKVFYFRHMMRMSVKIADHLIFVSHSVLNDCSARLSLPKEKATVIPHGKSDIFGRPLSEARLAEVRHTYGLEREFILYLGTIEPRKNLVRLVEAFARLAMKYPNVQLVLAGKKGWMTQELVAKLDALGLGSRIIFPGFIPEVDKAALLAACTVFIYPSLYEGFGLPVLEALASGAPVITSDISSLPEVAGGAAILIDPQSTEALSDAMDELLQAPEQRAILKELGPQQAAKFSWERTADLTTKVYAVLDPSSLHR